MKTSEGDNQQVCERRTSSRCVWVGLSVTWASQQLLQVVEQSEAFLIGDRGEGVVGIHLLQAGHQVGQRVVGAKRVHLEGTGEERRQGEHLDGSVGKYRPASGSHRVLQVLPAAHGFKLPELLALHTPADHPLQVDRVALVQPEGAEVT